MWQGRESAEGRGQRMCSSPTVRCAFFGLHAEWPARTNKCERAIRGREPFVHQTADEPEHVFREHLWNLASPPSRPHCWPVGWFPVEMSPPHAQTFYWKLCFTCRMPDYSTCREPPWNPPIEGCFVFSVSGVKWHNSCLDKLRDHPENIPEHSLPVPPPPSSSVTTKL